MKNDFIGDFFIQDKNTPKIFKLFNTISKTQKANRMGYSKTKRIVEKLGYQCEFIGNKNRLVEKKRA